MASNASTQRQPPPPPPPVIPTSWLAPHEQRYLFASIFGLVEIIKIWDISSPYFIPHPEPTWSSHIRVQGFWSALIWLGFEVSALLLVSCLRIPLLSPGRGQLGILALVAVGWNLVCWLVADLGGFLRLFNIIGPAALGGEWWTWYYALKRSWQPNHIEGIHKIRLLPHSTATLNPLSLSYCIPPDHPQPLYIPIVFNNSRPDQVSYFIRSLDTGHTETKTISHSSLKRSSSHLSTRGAALKITNEEDEEDVDGPEVDPEMALVLHGGEGQVDVSRLPSVKPADSLALVPKGLKASQDVLFIKVDKPGVVSLKSVLDRRGDRFQIAPHKEAVIIECPTGGHFLEGEKEEKKKKGDKNVPAELRCLGEEEVVNFEARGVGALRVGWKKKSRDSTSSGTIEGIEEDLEPVDELALVRRDRVSKTHTVPLRIQHDTPGLHTISLKSVSDSMHNTYNPTGNSAKKVYNVIPRSTVRFDCNSPKELLMGRNMTLQLSMEGVENTGSTEPIEVSYSHRQPDGRISEKSIKVARKVETITVDEPGSYTLQGIKGSCEGTIMEPATCVVQLVPLPTVKMAVTTLHECAMDVGVTATFDFTGTPPFTIEYTEQRDRQKAHTKTARFKTMTGEIVLQPENEGQYTYTMTSLSDAKYNQVKLEIPPIKQTVHPLANVELFGPRKRKMFACSGNDVEIEFEARGATPLSLTFLQSSLGKTENITRQISAGRQKLSIALPSPLRDDEGGSGKFTITLSSIEDGNGCVRRLPSPNVEVDVNREKPTARFAKSDKVIITEGESVKAGLRLTGEPPWVVTYSRDGKDEKAITLRDPNNNLTFDKKGVYRLSNIKDTHCKGDIIHNEATFEIDYKPRPSVEVLTSPTLRQAGNNYRHKGLCAGEEDQVAIRFAGQSPFELGYRYTAEGKTSRHTLKSAKETGILHLATEPGQHRYDLTQLKDSNYDNNPISLSIEHDVHSRPSVTFDKHHTGPLCLDSSLHTNAKISLTGKAPFQLQLSVRKTTSTKTSQHTLSIPKHEWTLDLPEVILGEVGKYEISIVSITDDSGCLQDVLEGDTLSTNVEVVESARIVAVNPHVRDLCVGDTLDFLLQGKAPWTVEYEWLNKKHKVTSSSSRFTRYAEEKGVFKVKSVALKDNQCKREISDLERTVHALPSVRIQEGLDSLREGDEPVAFSVALKGIPPFSFTYTRSELVGSRMKVVETQTVTDIHDNVYTISSSAPGDYAVTSVSDKFCRYPPLSKGKEGR